MLIAVLCSISVGNIYCGQCKNARSKSIGGYRGIDYRKKQTSLGHLYGFNRKQFILTLNPLYPKEAIFLDRKVTKNAMTHHTVASYEAHVRSLMAACDWIGIDQGRAAQYGPLIRELFEGTERSREHILAYNESCEITDIYELWETNIDNFPNLHKKIRSTFSKGPILREDEKSYTSSNQARNDAFVYLLAGKFIRAGMTVVAVNGILSKHARCESEADITFDWNGSAIDVECKRPQTRGKVQMRVKEACGQLTNPKRLGRPGIVSLDYSAFIRRPGTVIEKDSAEEAEAFLAQLLKTAVTRQMAKRLTPTILGFLLFARAPAMIRKGHSKILSADGTPLQRYFRPESVSTSLIVINANSSHREVLDTVFQMLYQSLSFRRK